MKNKRWRPHKRRHFKKSRFKHFSSNKYSSNKTSLQHPVSKAQPKKNYLSRLTLRYKLLIGLLILNVISFFFLDYQIFFLVIGLDILFVILYLWGWTNACPRCHSHWAKRLVDRTNFGSHTEFENVNRTMTHTDSRGNVIGSSSVRDSRPVTMHTIQNHWVCKYCNHSWSGRVHDVR